VRSSAGDPFISELNKKILKISIQFESGSRGILRLERGTEDIPSFGYAEMVIPIQESAKLSVEENNACTAGSVGCEQDMVT
jgi:hypothetical protein